MHGEITPDPQWRQAKIDALTPRERDVLDLMVADLSNAEIAERLVMTLGTVRWYVNQIYSKLGVHSRDEAIAKAANLNPTPPVPAAAPTPINLPATTTSLVGREREIAAVRQRLLREDVRLLTLVGTPGIGKTRLSLETAATLLPDFPDGVYFVPLAPLSDPALVPNAIAQPLGIHETGGQSIKEMLKYYLRDKSLLLVLDNFEHLLPAAPLVAELLSAAAHLKVLATSREALHLYGEQEYPVPPLALPDPKRNDGSGILETCESVALFVMRAQAVKPEFGLTAANADAVAGICVRLDGLPLAIELAAARVKLYTPQALLERLNQRLSTLTGGARDLPERHQTLRSAIAWSYDLLTDDEKRLFARLGVFVGGWTLEAMQAVCVGASHDSPLQIDVDDSLESLLNKSLVQQTQSVLGTPRFTMLETLREYALEQLAVAEELDAVRQRHADYFTALAELADAQWFRNDPLRWRTVLETEHDNFRLALSWSGTGLQLAVAMHEFWMRCGYMGEGSRWLAAGLAQQEARLASLPHTAAHRALRAKGLYWLARFSVWQGDVDTPMARYEESLAIFRELQDAQGIASTLGDLSSLFHMNGDRERAITLAGECLTLFRQLGDPSSIAWGLALLGWPNFTGGNLQEAKRLWEESLSMFREGGGSWGVASVSINLALIALEQDDYPQTREYLTESMIRYQQLGERWQVIHALDLFACMIAAEAQAREDTHFDNIRAVHILGAVEVLCETFGTPFSMFRGRAHERVITRLRDQLDTATFAAAFTEGQGMTLEQVVAYALSES